MRGPSPKNVSGCMIAVSPWAKQGHISHTYTDHVSVLKFIESNWSLDSLSARSLDNLRNPRTSSSSPYVPTNGPAIGDLMDMFNFHGVPQVAAPRLPAPHLGVCLLLSG
jgi:phospholipase C